MSRPIPQLDDKRTTETKKYSFDFTNDLASGETISTAGTTTATVLKGTDASPSSMISGAATISGNALIQMLTGGTEGVIYAIKFSATTSESQVIDGIVKLYVTDKVDSTTVS
jgi:hypothetical protein